MNLYNIHPDPENAPYREWAFDLVPELVWEKFYSKSSRRRLAELKKREAVLAKDMKYAYLYAVDVLYGPFPAGEAAIAKDAHYAYCYARDVLRGRFLAGEVAIMNEGNYFHYYKYMLENISTANYGAP